MKIVKPLDLQQWITAYKDLLKPPVGNQVLFDSEDFIVMVVGGPNQRKDFHTNATEELFYQIQGEILLRIYLDQKFEDIIIKPGELFLLPGNIPHSPIRGKDTIGLVIEKKRQATDKDSFTWFCENCQHKLYEESIYVADIVNQLPLIFDRFYQSEELRTCKHCGVVAER